MTIWSKLKYLYQETKGHGQSHDQPQFALKLGRAVIRLRGPLRPRGKVTWVRKKLAITPALLLPVAIALGVAPLTRSTAADGSRHPPDQMSAVGWSSGGAKEEARRRQ